MISAWNVEQVNVSEERKVSGWSVGMYKFNVLYFEWNDILIKGCVQVQGASGVL